MTRKSFDQWMREHQERVEACADAYMPEAVEYPAVLHEAMRYAVVGGGKRIRPLLVYAFSEMCGGDKEDTDKVALSIECIHSYSLIHDDLPCMDNDMLRHGKPTTHAVYGEAMAMLAGDALQPFAFNLLTNTSLSNKQKVAIIDRLAYASGSYGMCGGQAVDLSVVGKEMGLDDLAQMHLRKTGQLISASVDCGCLCGNPKKLKPKFRQAAADYGFAIGLMYQIVDDILDVTSDAETLGKTAGKDAADNKPTYVSVLGIVQAQDFAQQQYQLAQSCIRKLADIVGKSKVKRIEEITDLLYLRKY